MFPETNSCKGCHGICRVTLYFGNCGCPLCSSFSQEYGKGEKKDLFRYHCTWCNTLWMLSFWVMCIVSVSIKRTVNGMLLFEILSTDIETFYTFKWK